MRDMAGNEFYERLSSEELAELRDNVVRLAQENADLLDAEIELRHRLVQAMTVAERQQRALETARLALLRQRADSRHVAAQRDRTRAENVRLASLLEKAELELGRIVKGNE